MKAISLALFCAFSPALAQEQPGLVYEVAVVLSAERCQLQVAMHFRGDEDGVSAVDLPRCGYGTPRIWESLRQFEVVGAELEEQDRAPYRRRLIHEPSAPVTLRYVVDYDPSIHDGVAYRPSVGTDHFHFFDFQWRVRLLGRAGEREHLLEVVDLPEGWTVGSNLGEGPGPHRKVCADDELSVFLAGGDYRRAQFGIGDKPVNVLVRGFADSEGVIASLERILAYQGQQFGSFEGARYLVCLSPRPRIRAGVAIDDAFVCLADPGTEVRRLEVLLAHEFFHNWLPRTGCIDVWRDGNGLDEFRLDWFHEGFTEFAARRMLLDSGQWELADYVARFNEDLAEQGRNHQRAASLEAVDRRRRAGSFTHWEERTSYFRGPLVALRWDREMRQQGSGTVLELVQAFVREAAATGGAMSESDFFDLVEGFGVDGRGAYQRHIVEGVPPSLPVDCFAPQFRAEVRRNVPYDPGFDVHASRDGKRVVGVVTGGAAHRAGLRDGMEVLSLESTRKPDREMVLEVRGVAGEQRIAYRPAGAPVETMRFVRVR